MLDAVKFVRGFAAHNDSVPALLHCSISNKLIRSFNGIVAACAPIQLDMDAKPKADIFFKAIAACKEPAQFSLIAGNKLSIKSGKLRAIVDCFDEKFPVIHPEGAKVLLDGKFLDAVKALAPFIAEDTAREWARGLLFRGASAFATNNIIIIEYWLGYNFPVEIVLPYNAVKELIRINEEPEALQVSSKSVTFHFAGNRWILVQNRPLVWPNMTSILERDSAPIAFSDTFFDALHTIKPFVEASNLVFLLDGKISSSPIAEQGTTVDVANFVGKGCFNIKQLLLLESLATSIDFAAYPAPCLFFGDKIRGAVVGVHDASL